MPNKDKDLNKEGSKIMSARISTMYGPDDITKRNVSEHARIQEE